MFKKHIIKVIILFLILINIFNIEIFAITDNESNTQKFIFDESIEEFNNPDMGIYRPIFIKCMVNGEWSKTKIQYPNGLVHLRFGIADFSEKNNKVKDYDFTEEHINKLNEYMNQVRDAGGTAIVRFAYDNFNGVANAEPDIEVIEKHISELKPFFEANEDIIACVETGFLGPYGEQHTSKIVNQENIKRVTNKLLEVVPESRTVNVRKPLWYCGTVDVNIDDIDKDISEYGTSAYRIGMFNDGYLGSSSDLGSFKDRSKALKWLSNQATHTLYGGEVAWIGNELDENGNMYHSIEHIKEEMFQTHTSYLNEEWNDKVIKEWKNDTYVGSDSSYNNKSAYLYIKNHLGYRLVLNECNVIKENNKIDLSLNIKNVGAGNVVNEKDTYIVLKNESNEYSFKTLIDIRKIMSKEEKELNIKLNTENIDTGEYDIYLKIINKNEEVDVNKRTIRLANNDIWNKDIGANKIGNINIEKVSYQKGDLDKNGIITINDLAMLKLYLIGKIDLPDDVLQIADLDQTGTVTINDLAKLRLKLIGLL